VGSQLPFRERQVLREKLFDKHLVAAGGW